MCKLGKLPLSNPSIYARNPKRAFLSKIMQLLLQRYAYCQHYTAGRIIAPNLTIETVELPWMGNKPFESCIPPGRYPVVTRETKSKGRHWLLCGVPERDLILIHAANYASELQGCIAPGLGSMWDCHKNEYMVTHSQDAMAMLARYLGETVQFDLDIINFYPEYP